MNPYQKLLFLLTFLTLTSCDLFHATQKEKADKELSTVDDRITDQWFTIKKFVDGDTFWIEDGSTKGLKIRFIGVDTPESRPLFGNPAEPYGKTAADYVEQRIGKNGKVRLELDVDPLDRYGRTLAYIYLEDGTFLNQELVENGLAQVMTIAPNVKHVDSFLAAQKRAQAQKMGIWSTEIKP